MVSNKRGTVIATTMFPEVATGDYVNVLGRALLYAISH